MDELYELALATGLQLGTMLLSGPHTDDVVPVELYRRLTRDLTANGCTVVADLSGERLDAVLDAGVHLVKVCHEELLDCGRTKSDEPADLVVHSPPLEPQDPRGAGDSMTAGMTARLARGDSVRTALRTGAACGALNVVRRGLGTGGADAVEAIGARVRLTPWDAEG